MMMKQHVYNNELVVISTLNKETSRVSITVVHNGQPNPIKHDVPPFVHIGLSNSDFYSGDMMQSLEHTMHVFARHYMQVLDTPATIGTRR